MADRPLRDNVRAPESQLARIAAADADPPVHIVKLDAVGGIFLWLCKAHEKERAKKWPVIERRRPPGKIDCDDCRAERGLTR